MHPRRWPVSISRQSQRSQNGLAPGTRKGSKEQTARFQSIAGMNESARQVIHNAKAKQMDYQVEGIRRTGLLFIEFAERPLMTSKTLSIQPFGEDTQAIANDQRFARFELHEIEPVQHILSQCLDEVRGCAITPLPAASPRPFGRRLSAGKDGWRRLFHAGAVPCLRWHGKGRSMER